VVNAALALTAVLGTPPRFAPEMHDRLGRIAGAREYHWHKHDRDDEFFYVVEGELLIDLQDRSVELAPRGPTNYCNKSTSATSSPLSLSRFSLKWSDLGG
jgi:Cupin domain